MCRVLVIAPHPDDEVLGCGGSIAKHRAAGRPVHLLYLTSGEHGGATDHPEGLGSAREREAIAATGVLGVTAHDHTWLRLADGELDPHAYTAVGLLVSALRRLRPTLLYLPHPGEGSFDHRAAYELCWRAAGMAGSINFRSLGSEPWWVPTILGYEVWTPIADAQYSEDITEEIELKITALSHYRSQSPSTKGDRQPTYAGPAARHLPGYRGAMTVGGYREAFQVLRLGALALTGQGT